MSKRDVESFGATAAVLGLCEGGPQFSCKSFGEACCSEVAGSWLVLLSVSSVSEPRKEYDITRFRKQPNMEPGSLQ